MRIDAQRIRLLMGHALPALDTNFALYDMHVIYIVFAINALVP